MFVRLVICSALFLGSFAARLAPTSSTVDATITPGPNIELLRKQNNDRFIGWVMNHGTFTSEECDIGSVYNEASSYWGCCATTDGACAATDRFLGCISGKSIIWSATRSGSTYRTSRACSSIYTSSEDLQYSICNTAYMYENDRDTEPLTMVNCGGDTILWSYYRVKPVISTPPPEKPSTPTPAPTPTPPTPIPPPSPEKKSKAWIAGAVVGPIVGIALIGALAWLFMRRRKNAQAQSERGGLPTASASHPQPPYSPGPPLYYPPPMQQYQESFGAVPFGVSKHDANVPPQSPISHSSTSPGPYGASTVQQWQNQQQYDLHIGQAPNPPTSPQQWPAQPGMFQHTSETVRPFSSELDGSGLDSQPEHVSVQPKK